jgi:hypothetical protein
LTASPAIAATNSTTTTTTGFSAPVAASAPAANNRESPGRIGVTTRPVSAKTMTKSIP